jgi:histidine phosphotransferase ChpT
MRPPWGGAPGDLDAAGLAALLGGASMAPRVRFALDRLAPEGAVPAALVPLALNAALLAAEALPHGGTVHLGGDAEQGLTVWSKGRAAAWPPGLLASLSGTAPPDPEEGGPRRVLIPLTLALAEEAGWRVSVGLGPAGLGLAAPLVLAPA